MSFNSNKKSLPGNMLSPWILFLKGKRFHRCYVSLWIGNSLSNFLSSLIFITILSSLFFRAVQKAWAKDSLQQAEVYHKLIIAQRFGPSQFFIQQNHPKNYKGGQQWIH